MELADASAVGSLEFNVRIKHICFIQALNSPKLVNCKYSPTRLGDFLEIKHIPIVNKVVHGMTESSDFLGIFAI